MQETQEVQFHPWVGKTAWHGNRLQHSCLENPTDRGAWWATVHGVAESQTGLKQLNTHRAGVLPQSRRSL